MYLWINTGISYHRSLVPSEIPNTRKQKIFSNISPEVLEEKGWGISHPRSVKYWHPQGVAPSIHWKGGFEYSFLFRRSRYQQELCQENGRIENGLRRKWRYFLKWLHIQCRERIWNPFPVWSWGSGWMRRRIKKYPFSGIFWAGIEDCISLRIWPLDSSWQTLWWCEEIQSSHGTKDEIHHPDEDE